MSSLLLSTQVKLAQVIQAIAQAEIQTEKKRQELGILQLFETVTAFSRLDQSRVGSIRLSELREFLEDNKIVITEAELVYLFKKLDWDHDGRVSQQDFSKFVVPRKLKSAINAREPYVIEVGMLLPNEVEFTLANLFQQEVTNYRNLLVARSALVSSLDYSTLEAFKTLDLFNQGFVTMDSLQLFVKKQGYGLNIDEIEAFFRSVDLDEDGKISYSELIEAVHLYEPLPYRIPSSISIREAELQSALERSRSLERIYYPYYPYYFSPYYPYYYPSYYPYLRVGEQRLRESSLEFLRKSRLAQIDAESKWRDQENDRRRSLERQRSAERLRQIQEESLLRQAQINESNRIRELDRIRNDELRRSRERIRDIEHDNRLRQIETESKVREYDRQNRLYAIEKESQIRLLENERKLVESDVRLRSLERLSSLERLQQLENIRRLEGEAALNTGPSCIRHTISTPMELQIRLTNLSIDELCQLFSSLRRSSPVSRAIYESKIYESPLKYQSVLDSRKREFKVPNPMDKSGQLQQSLKRSLL